MKAVLHHNASAGFRAKLAAAAPDWLETVVVELADADGFAREIRDAEVLLHVLHPTSESDIAAGPRLRLIQKIGVGVDTIDLAAAKARGIAVCNMPGTNTPAVVEMTLALMLAALRRLAALDRATRAGRGWQMAADDFDRVGELAGRTVGLVGYGRVARALSPILAALGARVVVTSRERIAAPGLAWRSFESLLAEADIVSLHLPLTEETRGMMGPAAFAAMRPGAVLVNTARGALVDEAALVEALDGGRLAAAGLDVFAAEPVGPDHPLARFDNVVLAPHVAWLTPETLARSLEVAVDNCRRLRDGEPLVHRVV